MKTCFAAGLLALAAGVAQADSEFDARAVGGSQRFDSAAGSLDGLGFAVGGRFEASDTIFVRADLLMTRSENNGGNGNSDFRVYRGGLGYQHRLPGFVAYGAFDLIRMRLKLGPEVSEDSGFLAAVGIRDAGDGPWLWQAELGALSMDEPGAGIDLQLGYRASPNITLLTGLQSYLLGGKGDRQVTHGTAGIRFHYREP